jgi:hypothetical protein
MIVTTYCSTIIPQQNVKWSESNMQSSQTLRATSPLLLSTSRCSHTPLKLSIVLSDCGRAFSGAPESTWSYASASRMLQDVTYRIVKFWSSGDLYADLWETLRAAQQETSSAALQETWCRILTAVVFT